MFYTINVIYIEFVRFYTIKLSFVQVFITDQLSSM